MMKTQPSADQKTQDADLALALKLWVVLARAHTHATLWCTLITAWMVLEIAIVVRGVRVFGRLRAIVEETRDVR